MNSYKKKINVNTKKLSLSGSKIELLTKKYKYSPRDDEFKNSSGDELFKNSPRDELFKNSPREEELEISSREGDLGFKINPKEGESRTNFIGGELMISPREGELRISIIDRISEKIYGSISLSCDVQNWKSVAIPSYIEYVIKIESLFRDMGIFYELEQGTVSGINLQPKSPIRIYCYGDVVIRGYRLFEKGAFVSVPSTSEKRNIIVLKFKRMRMNVNNVEEVEKIGEYTYKLKLHCGTNK